MNNGKLPDRDIGVLPLEIRQQSPGKVIIFSEDQQRVIGAGDTEDEAFDQAEASGVDGLWHISYGTDPDPDVFNI